MRGGADPRLGLLKLAEPPPDSIYMRAPGQRQVVCMKKHPSTIGPAF